MFRKGKRKDETMKRTKYFLRVTELNYAKT